MAPDVVGSPTDWTTLKDKFKSKFALPDFYNHIWSQILKLQQKPDEPALVYVTKKDALARKIALNFEQKQLLILEGL